MTLFRAHPLAGLVPLLLVLAGCGGEDQTIQPDAGARVVESDCVVGTLECSCAPSGGCALDDDGQLLQCVAGVCLRPSCPPGKPGCACIARDER